MTLKDWYGSSDSLADAKESSTVGSLNTLPPTHPYVDAIPTIPYTVRVDEEYLSRLNEMITVFCRSAAHSTIEEMLQNGHRLYPMLPEPMARAIALSIKRHSGR